MKVDCKASPPTVSIVLPTYNRAGKILRAIDSVLTQSYTDFELIIVDDASTDNTRQKVNSKCDMRIKYIKHAQQKGPGASRNTGIYAASGKYIAFQDSDDEWLKTKLEEQMMIMTSDPSVGAVFSPFLRVSPELKDQIPSRVTPAMHGDIFSAILGVSFVGTPTLLVRRSVLFASGLFDESLPTLEDWDISIRLAKSCRFACVEHPLMLAYVTSGSVSENEEVQLHTRELILAKHKDYYISHPKSKANVLTFIGNRRCLSGEMGKGRDCFFRALRCDCFNVPALFGLLVSYVGRLPYRWMIYCKRCLS